VLVRWLGAHHKMGDGQHQAAKRELRLNEKPLFPNRVACSFEHVKTGYHFRRAFHHVRTPVRKKPPKRTGRSTKRTPAPHHQERKRSQDEAIRRTAGKPIVVVSRPWRFPLLDKSATHASWVDVASVCHLTPPAAVLCFLVVSVCRGQSVEFDGEPWNVTTARKEESMRRVVVTGLGTVAATGNCVSESWEAALAGRSGVGRISLFDASDFTVKIAAEVKDFDPSTVMSLKEARQSSRFVQFAAAAAREALDDSGLDVTTGSERYGCAIGVGLGGIGKIEQGAYTCRDKGPTRISPLFLPYVIPNMAAGFVSVALGLRGPNFSTATACASGTHAIGEAFLHVAMGTADAMIAGGTEATISPLCVASFAKMKALSTRNDAPAEASRPFDLDRDGFVMGEGSGLVVIEELEHAKQRGARIYAEVVGYGLSGDAHHITSPTPDGNGAARCMAAALQAGRITPEQLDYINAHGTSTKPNDASESKAIATVLGDHAMQVCISSTKGVTGHCLGAAGGIEAIYTVLAIHHSVIPPTANYATPDPDCPLDYTTEGARERSIRYALSNSVGFGGQNACLAFSRLF